jgi:hypothetical protein
MAGCRWPCPSRGLLISVQQCFVSGPPNLSSCIRLGWSRAPWCIGHACRLQTSRRTMGTVLWWQQSSHHFAASSASCFQHYAGRFAHQLRPCGQAGPVCIAGDRLNRLVCRLLLPVSHHVAHGDWDCMNCQGRIAAPRCQEVLAMGQWMPSSRVYRRGMLLGQGERNAKLGWSTPGTAVSSLRMKSSLAMNRKRSQTAKARSFRGPESGRSTPAGADRCLGQPEPPLVLCSPRVSHPAQKRRTRIPTYEW